MAPPTGPPSANQRPPASSPTANLRHCDYKGPDGPEVNRKSVPEVRNYQYAAVKVNNKVNRKSFLYSNYGVGAISGIVPQPDVTGSNSVAKNWILNSLMQKTPAPLPVPHVKTATSGYPEVNTGSFNNRRNSLIRRNNTSGEPLAAIPAFRRISQSKTGNATNRKSPRAPDPASTVAALTSKFSKLIDSGSTSGTKHFGSNSAARSLPVQNGVKWRTAPTSTVGLIAEVKLTLKPINNPEVTKPEAIASSSPKTLPAKVQSLPDYDAEHDSGVDSVTSADLANPEVRKQPEVSQSHPNYEYAAVMVRNKSNRKLDPQTGSVPPPEVAKNSFLHSLLQTPEKSTTLPVIRTPTSGLSGMLDTAEVHSGSDNDSLLLIGRDGSKTSLQLKLTQLTGSTGNAANSGILNRRNSLNRIRRNNTSGLQSNEPLASIPDEYGRKKLLRRCNAAWQSKTGSTTNRKNVQSPDPANTVAALTSKFSKLINSGSASGNKHTGSKPTKSSVVTGRQPEVTVKTPSCDQLPKTGSIDRPEELSVSGHVSLQPEVAHSSPVASLPADSVAPNTSFLWRNSNLLPAESYYEMAPPGRNTYDTIRNADDNRSSTSSGGYDEIQSPPEVYSGSRKSSGYSYDELSFQQCPSDGYILPGHPESLSSSALGYERILPPEAKPEEQTYEQCRPGSLPDPPPMLYDDIQGYSGYSGSNSYEPIYADLHTGSLKTCAPPPPLPAAEVLVKQPVDPESELSSSKYYPFYSSSS